MTPNLTAVKLVRHCVQIGAIKVKEQFDTFPQFMEWVATTQRVVWFVYPTFGLSKTNPSQAKTLGDCACLGERVLWWPLVTLKLTFFKSRHSDCAHVGV